MSTQQKLEELSNTELVEWIGTQLRCHGILAGDLCLELDRRLSLVAPQTVRNICDEQVEPFWMIVNTERARPTDHMETEFEIPLANAPMYMHATREGAETELLRLAKINTGKFVLLEAVARVSSRELLVGRWEKVLRVEPIIRAKEAR